MFEIELIICIKMDLALNNLQSKPTNQPAGWAVGNPDSTCSSQISPYLARRSVGESDPINEQDI